MIEWSGWSASQTKPRTTISQTMSVSCIPVLSASLKLTTRIAKQFGDDEGAGEWNKTHVAMLDRSETAATQTKLMLAIANAADVLHNKVPVADKQKDKNELVNGAKALLNKLKVASLIPKQLLGSLNGVRCRTLL